MNGFSRVLRTALYELSSAIRSRRAIVTMLLFALIGAGVMYMVVGVFSTIEEQVVSSLGLPAAENPGGVSMTLWRSSGFKAVMSHSLGSNLLFNEMLAQHPLAIAFGIFIFAVVPLITLITCAPTAASEIRSGSVRYVLLRVSRTEWTLGLFLAEAIVLLVSMLFLAAAASGMALYRLPDWSALGFAPSIFEWSVRAWVYSLAWLGIFLGASMCVKSTGKATGLSILIIVLTIILGVCAKKFCPMLDLLRPEGFYTQLWRHSFPAMLEGVVGAISLAFLYLGLGSAVFARRDV